MNNLIVFGLNGSKSYAKKVCSHLDVNLSSNTEKYFDDGESYIKSDVNVREADVYIISSIYSDSKQTVNEKLVNLLWFIGSLRDASAGRITAIIPYMGYARQDRKTESRAPITTKYLSQVFKSVGLDRMLAIDIHNPSAFQNGFRIPIDNLDSFKLFTDYLCEEQESHTAGIFDPPFLVKGMDDLVVLSPDIGGMTRSGFFQTALSNRLGVDIPLAVFDKRRIDGQVHGSRIIGNVENKKVLIFDDMIATGSTISKAVEAVDKHGGRVIGVCATHGLFTGNANEALLKIDNLFITDTVPPWRLDLSRWNNKKLRIVPTFKLVAKAIRRTHEAGGSISDLLKA